MVLFAPTVNSVIDISNIQNSFVFLANKISVGEVFSRQLFGLPSDRNNYLQQLSDIVPGKSLLFLFNMTTRVLHGIFVPTCLAGAYIEPTAWRGKFPVQIRFSLFYGYDGGQPLLLHEKFFPDFLGCEYNKCRKLDKKQTEQLVTAFLTLNNSSCRLAVPKGWVSLPNPHKQRPFFQSQSRGRGRGGYPRRGDRWQRPFRPPVYPHPASIPPAAHPQPAYPQPAHPHPLGKNPPPAVAQQTSTFNDWTDETRRTNEATVTENVETVKKRESKNQPVGAASALTDGGSASTSPGATSQSERPLPPTKMPAKPVLEMKNQEAEPPKGLVTATLE